MVQSWLLAGLVAGHPTPAHSHPAHSLPSLEGHTPFPARCAESHQLIQGKLHLVTVWAPGVPL